jgi:heterodisulfide reductase subunit C
MKAAQTAESHQETLRDGKEPPESGHAIRRHHECTACSLCAASEPSAAAAGRAHEETVA